MPASTPKPPYYAVVFTTIVSPATEAHFRKLIDFVRSTAPAAPGYLGLEEAKGDKEWITAVYWSDMAFIDEWAKSLKTFAATHPVLMVAFLSSKARICRVEKALP